MIWLVSVVAREYALSGARVNALVLLMLGAVMIVATWGVVAARRGRRLEAPGNETLGNETGQRAKNARENRVVRDALRIEAPLTNYTRGGRPSDPLNIRVVATQAQLTTAFVGAGWYRADEIGVVTTVRIVLGTAFATRYAQAPVSDLYVYGRRQDLAFQRPGRSVRERDHVRFWDTGERASDGRPIWVGGATKDIAVELAPANRLPTHKIAPDVDTEREIVAHDLIASGWVVGLGWAVGFGAVTQSENGGGDPYVTDGRVVTIALADVPVLEPLAPQARTPLTGRIERLTLHAFRWALPRRGLLLARRQARGELLSEPPATEAEAVPSGASETPTAQAPRRTPLWRR